MTEAKSKNNVVQFPTYCLRGLRSKDHVTDEGVLGAAFEPNYKLAKEKPRPDSGFETSINWEDDETVLEFTRRDASLSTFGVARISLDSIKKANEYDRCKGAVLYERQEIKNKNKYHGNVVFGGHLDRTVIKMIASTLALQSTFIRPANDKPVSNPEESAVNQLAEVKL